MALSPEDFTAAPPGAANPADFSATPPPPRSALGEIATAGKRGVYEVPGIVGRAAQFVSSPGNLIHDYGKKAADYSKEQLARPDLELHPEQHNFVTNALASGAEMVPQIAGPVAGGLIAGALAPESAVAGIGAAAIGALPFAGSAGQETREKAEAAGKTPEEVDSAGRVAAGANLGSMVVGGAAGGALVKGAGRVAGKFLPGAAEDAAGAATKALTPPTIGAAFGKQAAVDAGQNVGMGIATPAAQADVEQRYGLGKTSAWEAAKEAALPSAGAALLFGPLSYLHAHKAVKDGTVKTQAIRDALANPDTHDMARNRAAGVVYEAMKKADPDGANMWRINAEQAIKSGKPIGLDNTWTKGLHPEIFPDSREPAPEETMDSEGGGQQQGVPPPVEPDLSTPFQSADMEGEGGGQEQGVGNNRIPRDAGISTATMDGNTPFELSRQHATQAAVDANDQLHAQRAAYEAEQARLRSSGPMGSAAAEANDSGAAAHKAGEVQAQADAEAQNKATEEAAQRAKEAAADSSPTGVNVRSILNNVKPLDLATAQQRATKASSDYTVVPHPSGDGFGIVPTHLLDPEVAVKHAEHQPKGDEEFAANPVQEAQPFTEREQAPAAEQAAPEPIRSGSLDIPDHSAAAGHEPEQPAAAQISEPMRAIGAREALPEEKSQLDESMRSLPPALQHGNTVHTFDHLPDMPDATGVYHNGETAIKADLLRKAATGDPNAKWVVRANMLHENVHGIDDKDGRGINFASAEHPAFASHEDANGVRHADGGILKEVLRAAQGQKSSLRDFFRYPMNAWTTKAEAMGLTPKEAQDHFARESLAQIMLAHDSHPDVMAKEMPKAFALAERIHNESRVNEPRAGLQSALRALNGAGGLHTERAGQGGGAGARGAENGRAGAGLGQAAGVHNHPVEARIAGRASGASRKPDLIDLPKSSPGSFDKAREAAEDYMKKAGLDYNPPTHFVKMTPEYGAELAAAYKKMKDAPNDPKVKRAYDALISETIGQWRAMMKTGLKVDFSGPDHPYPYTKSPMDAVRDVRDNNHLSVYSTDEGFGDHSVNIGMDAKDGKNLTQHEITEALGRAGVRVRESAIHQSATEPTFVAQLDRALTPEEAHKVSVELRQESIAQKSGGKGELYGPEADKWKPFNNEYFLGLDGKPEVQGNPLLADSGIVHNGKKLLANDVFRAVHDYFGHVKEGVGFRADGEENAWASHAAMFSEEARKAMTTETRGQNSYLNWGPDGEHNRTANQGDTKYAPQKTGLLPNKYTLDTNMRGLDKTVSKNLTPPERERMQQGALSHVARRVKNFANIFYSLPKTAEYLHAALAGKAARGWYEKSRKAGEAMYGEDYPRFAALMAALSPQTDVETNFYNAAKVWAAWNREGRTTDPKAISRLLTNNVITTEGALAGKEAMTAYVLNSTRALAHATGDVQLSGPKVESFRQNLIGNLNEVTNDRHNAAFSGIMESLLGGDNDLSKVDQHGKTFGVKSPGYMALSARYRDAAKALSKLTGDTWSPAEVQETSWSFWRTLYNLATREGETRSALQLIHDGELTHDLIAQTPTLGQYFDSGRFKDITRGETQGAGGDSDRAGRLSSAERGAAKETGPVASTPAIERIARRLDDLIRERKAAGEERAAEKTTEEGNSALREAADDDVKARPALNKMDERPKSEKPFYSELTKAVTEKAPFSKSGEIDARMLNNWLESRSKDGTVKKAEIEATGLGDYLKLQDGKVTRDQVQKFLDQNGVKVEEHVLNDSAGADAADRARNLNRAVRAAEDRVNELHSKIVDSMYGKSIKDEAKQLLPAAEAKLADLIANRDRVVAEARDTIESNNPTKFASYQLPGGKNYRELLLTLPSKGPPDRGVPSDGIRPKRDINSDDFQSSHFDQPNILAHVRFNERTDANGKKVLFIEELQSDWAQKGRKEGFANQPIKPDAVRDGIGWAPIDADGLALAGTRHPTREAAIEAGSQAGRVQAGVPNAPFVGKTEAWTALALKRMVRYAAENGFDRVAWTNGEQQAARYDIGKKIDAIDHKVDGDQRIVQLQMADGGHVNLWADKNGKVTEAGGTVPAAGFEGHGLDEIIGKELSKKVLDGEGADRKNGLKRLSGVDLRVGGEGMKSFYDKIVPNVANDVLKKLGGGRVDDAGTVSAKGDLTAPGTKSVDAVQGFDITPQMRGKVVSEGVPLFNRMATVPSTEAPKGQSYGLYQDVDKRPGSVKEGMIESLQKLLAPTSRGGIATLQKGITRSNLARMDLEARQAEKQMEKYAAVFHRMSQADQVKFVNDYENGVRQTDPVLNEIARAIKAFNDDLRQRIQSLGTGKLEEFDESWLGRIWFKEGKGSGSTFARRPLEGSKGFLKQRVFDKFQEGLDAGEVPITYNPIEMMMLKGVEQRRYIYGQKIFGEMKDAGIVMEMKRNERGVLEQAPEGWTALSDKIAQSPHGVYYAPDEAATIFNNHLSPGLRGNGFYDAFHKAGMILNSAQLGLSLFHAGFTTVDSMVSKAALGIQQISRGNFLEGSGNVLQAFNPAQPFLNAYKGDRLLRASLGQLQDPSLAPIVEALVEGGGRIGMDAFYKNETLNAFRNAISRGDKLGVAKGVLPAILDKINAPIFDQLVPRQKLGIFFDLAKDWIERNPNATSEEKRAAMGKAWDSVDNRLGQLAYDNVFWNRTLKDLLMVSVRSVGWNLGTFRELGGGIADFKNIAKDKELSTRAAYVIALPFVTGLMGAMIGYMYTGNGPEELKDYFFPKTGRKRPDGTDDRMSLPSYMKDVYEYGHDISGFVKYGANPTQTLQNKMHPLLGVVGQMLGNKDFFGGAIRSPGDPAVVQLEDEAKYLINQIVPFGIRNYQQQAKVRKEEATPLGYIANPTMIGITPSPGYITKNDAQTQASALGAQKDAIITKYREALQNGDITPAEAARRMLNAGLRINEVHMVIRQGIAENKIPSRKGPRTLKDIQPAA